MDHLISMYIDNELSLDEKILFLKHAIENRKYSDEAIVYLMQEKKLRKALTRKAPEIHLLPSRAAKKKRVFAVAASVCFMFVLSFVFGTHFSGLPKTPSKPLMQQLALTNHRFIIYQQGTKKIELSGSFTNWKRVPLLPTGLDGYWEVTLPIPSGEHRYSFIIDGEKRIPDPTVASRESDDFGAVNSIIKVETSV